MGMVHEFNINQDIPIKHPIILMIDLRNIALNVNYNNADVRNNHRNALDIKFFYGFKQNRFKVECGFGGFQLPPLSDKAQIYQKSNYRQTRQKHKKEKRLKKKFKISSISNGHYCSDQIVEKQKDDRIKYQKRDWIKNEENKIIDSSSLHDNELRNLQIPFVQSLQSEKLSNLQNHINERVDFHYHEVIKNNSNKHKIKQKKKSENKENKDPNIETCASLMIEQCIKMSLKFPHFLPSKLLEDTGCDINNAINDIDTFEPMLRSLFKSLPLRILQKIFAFMQSKINLNEVDDDDKMSEFETQSFTKRRLLQKEIWNAFKCNDQRMENEDNGKHGDYEQLDSSSSTAISSGSLNSLSHSLNHRYL